LKACPPLWHDLWFEGDDVVMVDGVEAGSGRRPRRFRTVSEKRRIAELTLEPGASVALVARAHGVNANQVFKWLRALKRGELNEPAAASTALLPVTLSATSEAAIDTGEVGAKEQPTTGGSIHIEFPGRAMISVERGADPSLLKSILESLRK
jgi:transposase